MDKINNIKLQRKALYLLLNVFFNTRYPFFPILDEPNFRCDVSRIIGVDKNDLSDGPIHDVLLGSMQFLAFFGDVVNNFEKLFIII